jgi:ligand-binding SRPBCC domain-containing protein
MKTYLLEREQIVLKSKTETFDFFADAFNLERITPPFLRFRILTKPPIQMVAGALIEYRLALFGVGFRWKTLIEAWEPETHFVDRQLKGPYALWHHTHTFEEVAPGQTRMRDIVRYQIPFGPLGEIAHRLFVRRMLDQIFDYRAAATAEILGSVRGGVDTSEERSRSGASAIAAGG